jgi:outer membrane protein OmpA-like peptidoglycan-associated protein
VKILQKTTHSSGKLVDEGTVVKAENTRDEKKYLSYMLANGPDGLQSNFIIDSLNFASSSSVLPTEGGGINTLNNLVTFLNKNKYVKLNINGYTDASGIEENNVILSNERAQAVYDYLVAHGINSNRLQFKGRGSSSPIATNAYKWGRDINRRIEIEIVSD